MKNKESLLLNTIVGVGLSVSTLVAFTPDQVDAHYDPTKHPKIEKIKKGANDTLRNIERKTKEGVDYIERKIDDHEYERYLKNKRRELRELRKRKLQN
jgi:tRNA U34 2-thiouridine synthase MnmA/TrmU